MTNLLKSLFEVSLFLIISKTRVIPSPVNQIIENFSVYGINYTIFYQNEGICIYQIFGANFISPS
jgi:hypothetical protein